MNEQHPESVQTTPLVPGGSSCVTAILHDRRDGTLRFQPPKVFYFIPVFMFIFGCIFLFVALTVVYDPIMKPFFCIGAFIPWLIGTLVLFFTKKQAVFDFNRKCYWKDRRNLRMGENPERMKDYLAFKNIDSLQIITEHCRGSKGATWFSYELNIVCRDGKRLNVVDHGGLQQIRMDGRRLADALGVPLNEVKYRSENERKKKKADSKSLLIVACIMTFIFVMMVFTHVVIPLINLHRAKSWTPTPATVKICYLDTYTRKAKHGRKTYYFINIKFDYTYNGRTYQGRNFYCDNLNHGTRSQAMVDRMEQIIRQYPPRKQITCYVNPAKPREAIVRQELPLTFPGNFISAGFMTLLPLAFWIFYVLVKRKEKREKREGNAGNGL